MTTSLGDALPISGARALVDMRLNFARAFPCVVTDLATFEAEDISSEPYEALVYNGNVYAYDANDTTSVSDDGATTIVATGRRYILESPFRPGYRVLSQTLIEPPANPTLGDRYIVPVAPSGDWAAKARNIAQWTARGWVYSVAEIGQIVWIDAEEGYAHYTPTGEWTSGLPIGAIPAGSLTPTKLAMPAGLVVQDALADEPGGATSNGLAYLVGTPATGAFAGQDHNIVYREAGAWTFIAAQEGMTVFHLGQNSLLTHRSGLWKASVATPSRSESRIHQATVASAAGGHGGGTELLTFQHVAAIGERLAVEITFSSGNVSSVGTQQSAGFHILVDAETTARKSISSSHPTTLSTSGISTTAYLEFSDTLTHTIRIRWYASNDLSTSNTLSAAEIEVLSERVRIT